MGQVTVTLNGRSYRLRCGEGEEQRLFELAEHVRQRIDDLSYEFGHSGDERLLVMASLMIADELWDAKARIAALTAADDGQPEVEPVAPPPAPEPAPPAAGTSVMAPPSATEPFAQEPSLKRALRRPQARATLEERLGEVREAPKDARKSGAG
jgi:cell division protein ZapA